MSISPVVKLAWEFACVETTAAKMEFIEPEHFLAAMTKLGQLSTEEAAEAVRAEGLDPWAMRPEMELAGNVLEEAGVEPDAVRYALRDRLGQGRYEHRRGATMHRSERCRRLFDRAESMAASIRQGELSIGHLLLAILEDKDSTACRVLVEQGGDLDGLAGRIREKMATLPEQVAAGNAPVAGETASGTPFLDRFGRDLTVDAREGEIGPVIGRRREILEVIQTLARRSKNNPVLVGEAGVGKTAVAEAIAIRAAQGKDPHVLGGKRIVELNMSALVGGTKYRGQFEERLTRLVEECRSHAEIVLFVDELHTMIGTGRADGSMDAANILKPALARGDVRCIGATTVAEYQRYVESDPALERRFEKVIVPEPSCEETLEILQGLRPKWEEHHGAKVTDKALEAAVELSVKFDCDRKLPDKAIDLIDRAGARSRVPVLSMKLGEESPAGAAPTRAGTVTEVTVAQVLSEKMGVPLEVITGHLAGTGQSRLLDMETFLKQRVTGQDEAVEQVCQRLLMSHAGFGDRRGPLGVFLFVGPTGVGKTELVRSLAVFLFGSENALIRLDMSEFMEEHSAAKLIGSPPGYVGHEEAGQLTGKLRVRPYSVVLAS